CQQDNDNDGYRCLAAARIFTHISFPITIDDRKTLQFEMKIATYNVNSIRVRLDTILEWLDRHKPDVLCVQETKCQDEEFPALVLRSTGYHLHYRGMKSYNGVAVLSRLPPDEVFYGFDDQLPEVDDARLMRVVVNGIPIINTYVPNGYKV